MQRGSARARIFSCGGDYEAFAERLGDVVSESKTSCLAWVLMPNHVHFLLRTGEKPIGRVMQQLFTWYAGYYNRRHGRVGHVFQGRFKSIICEKDPYFLELVRYIHLNPVRGGIVRSSRDLKKYKWSGHGSLIGAGNHEWQDTRGVLEEFGRTVRVARQRYLDFIWEGFAGGHRKDLEGGGIFRSIGGVVEYLKDGGKKVGLLAGDERILGSNEFVDSVLAGVDREERRRSKLKRGGWDMESVVKRAAKEAGAEPGMVAGSGKTPRQCRARALACYWLVVDLGYSGAQVASYLDVTPAAVTVNVRRGRGIVEEEKLHLDRE